MAESRDSRGVAETGEWRVKLGNEAGMAEKAKRWRQLPGRYGQGEKVEAGGDTETVGKERKLGGRDGEGGVEENRARVRGGGGKLVGESRY